MPQPTLSRRDSTRGFVYAILSAVFLSSTAILIRYLTEVYSLPALVLAFWRDAFIGVTLGIVLLALCPSLVRTAREDRGYLWSYGVLVALFNAFWTLSVALNGAAVATVLAYCSTAFAALLEWRLLHEHLARGKALAIVLCLAGCGLVAGALGQASQPLSSLGLLTGLLSGLLYAIYGIMGRLAAQRGISPWTTLLHTFSVAALVLLLVNLSVGWLIPGGARVPGEMWWLGRSVSGWLLLILLAAGPSVLGFGLYNLSLANLPASTVNLLVTAEPVFTVLTAFFLLHERLTPPQLAGSALVIAAMAVVVRKPESV